MSFRHHFPAASWIWRRLTGKFARRFYGTVVLLTLIACVVGRVDRALQTR
jgi:hypothetical protein